jgi:ATP-dependent protease HslVU (ClpYQ) peptidase subunit
MHESTLHVVGGVYEERCISPAWDAIYGSAGRAALAISSLGYKVELHSYMDAQVLEQFQGLSCLREGFRISPTTSSSRVKFRYLHDLATPEIHLSQPARMPPIVVETDHVLRFGMLEGEAVVHAKRAVYDPQNQGSTTSFRENGSTAEQLALVLNLVEARKLSGLAQASAEECADAIRTQKKAEVIVVKMGPKGALVASGAGVQYVPAYKSHAVWKIGSGDVFAATFAHAWMGLSLTPVEAAVMASKATAVYCGTKEFATKRDLESFALGPVQPSERFLEGFRPKAYLAGPFFDLPQLWMVEQARLNLREVGLEVFSPFHDIGLGSANDVAAKDLEALDSCDIVFALIDGADTGTVFEVGYAVAKGIPVIAFSQREGVESLKMLEGTGCILCKDYATAIYKAQWTAAEL